MATQQLLARLKPYAPKKGSVVRIYMIDGVRFHADRGWYEVDDSLAEKLGQLTQDHYDPESPLLFDIVTQAEAERMEKAEAAREASARGTVSRPAPIVNTRAGGQRVKIEKKPVDDEATDAEWQELEGTGDLTSEDVRSGPPSAPSVSAAMVDPDPDGLELEEPDEIPGRGRAVEVGRVSGNRRATSVTTVTTERLAKPAKAAPVPRTRSRKGR